MMNSRCNGPILLGIVAICVALAVMEPDINVKKPYGPRMCQRFCNRISGCSSYICRTSDLSCDVTPITSPKQNPGKGVYLINVIKDKERKHAENAVNCTQGEKIFYTRGNIVQCRPIMARHPDLSSKGEETKGRMTRMLVFSKSNHHQPMRQIYLCNNSVAAYPFAYDKNVIAAAYISSHSKLVMSGMKPSRLIFRSIDNIKRNITKTKHMIQAIAIDDHKQLVFMKVIIPENCVCVMSTEGKNTKCMFSFRASCSMSIRGGFVADHKRSLIYALCIDSKMLQITYQGVSQGNVDGSETVRGYGLHMQGDVLYYQTMVKGSYHLHKLSLSDHTGTAFRTSTKINAILTVGNILYTTSFSTPADVIVFVGNMSGMGTVTKINMGFKYKSNLFMCLIP